MNHADIIVIGAGAAGLQAATYLLKEGKKVLLVEARDRIGGRVDTRHQNGIVFEAGAEFVHGKLPLTEKLATEARCDLEVVGGEWLQFFNGNWENNDDFVTEPWLLEKKLRKVKVDLPVAEFLKNEFQKPEHQELRYTVTKYVKGMMPPIPKKRAPLHSGKNGKRKKKNNTAPPWVISLY